MLVLDADFAAAVHEGYDFWIQEGADADAEVRASLERANEAIVPTVRLEKVEGAYWCRIEREHLRWVLPEDRKSTRLNSSHVAISYAVFCLKKKTKEPDKGTMNRNK